MQLQSLRVVGFALIVVALFCGCGKKEKGACVWGSGYSGRCWDNYTTGQCNAMNGSWHEGAKCSDFSYSDAAVPLLIISEVLYRAEDAGATLDWVELYNKSTEPISLEGCSVVYRSSGRPITVAPLDGVVPIDGTIVISCSEARGLNGLSRLSQSSGLDQAGRTATQDMPFVALYAPDDHFKEDQPLSAIVMGLVDCEELFGCMRNENIFEANRVVVGASLERVAWPINEWRTRAEPRPNSVDVRLKHSAGESQSTIVDVF